MNTPTDRRHFSRIPFDATVELTQQDKQWKCDLIDISLKGLLVKEQDEGELLSDYSITVKVVLAEDAEIYMQAALVRRENGCLGFVCTGTDLDSISHLRRLLELNLGDADLGQRELAELIAQSA